MNMRKQSRPPNWRSVGVCLASLIGLTGSVLHYQSLQNHSYLDVFNEQTLGGRLLPSGPIVPSWNRYGAFQRAYKQALFAGLDLFSLDDYLNYGIDHLLSRRDANTLIASYEQLLRNTPDDDLAWSDLAWIYAISGDTDKAIAVEQKAIALYKYDYTFYVLLGVFYQRAGHLDDAQIAYSNALALYPRLASSKFWKSVSKLYPGLTDAALHAALNQLNQRDAATRGITIDQVRARLMLAEGSGKNAKEILDNIEAKISNLSGVWELQGELDEKMRDLTQADLDFHRAIFLDTADPLPHERLAELELLQARNADKAKGEAFAALRLAMQMQSPGSKRQAVQYQREDGSRNGLLPATLLRETETALDLSSIFDQLSVDYESNGNHAEAVKMEDLAHRNNSKTGAPYGDVDDDENDH